MKLQARFVQLPVRYDAALLAEEISRLGEEAWRPHPPAGNDVLALISAEGDPGNESPAGQMRPTPHLRRCPYIVDVLASLGAALGRTQLMRIPGHADAAPHADVDYYWRERMRVHIPVVTQPTVSFQCGDQQVHMAAGECWIFDTWSRHRIINGAGRTGIHLVVDTVGGEGFWSLVRGGRVAGQPNPQNWAAKTIAPSGTGIEQLDLERQSMPAAMSPWEVNNHIDFLLAEAAPDQPGSQDVLRVTARFKHVWRALWAAYADDEGAWPRYRQALEDFDAALRASNARHVRLRNGADLYLALSSLVIGEALSDRPRAGERRADIASGVERQASGFAPVLPGEPDPRFDRPIFIVSPPRSGSSLLFETLAQAPGLYTIGGESHHVIEGVPELSIDAHNHDSNCLTAEDAQPQVVADLRARFATLLRDRDGAPAPQGRVRMLEKTPKNALRIPFLARAFPEARFIFLYRDPRQVLASMMEAWESGRFRTYQNLPGWRGERPWSMLLTPGWRDLADLPLNERVAAQWATATKILLDSLDAIARDRLAAVRYDAFLADPNGEVRRLCAAMGVGWDRRLGAELPLSRHTVSKPREDKWRVREAEIAAVLPALQSLIERAERAVAR